MSNYAYSCLLCISQNLYIYLLHLLLANYYASRIIYLQDKYITFKIEVKMLNFMIMIYIEKKIILFYLSCFIGEAGVTKFFKD